MLQLCRARDRVSQRKKRSTGLWSERCWLDWTEKNVSAVLARKNVTDFGLSEASPS